MVRFHLSEVKPLTSVGLYKLQGEPREEQLNESKVWRVLARMKGYSPLANILLCMGRSGRIRQQRAIVKHVPENKQ